MAYRREIDGLRAVAVLPVILFHAGFGAFSGGFVGVDVFFVISGFLITGLLIADLEAGRFSIARFYERRARRILPALIVVILCCLPFAFAWMLPSDFKIFAESLASVVLFISNFYFLSQVGYFAADAELQPLLHTWSLSVEEQFYLLFPLLLLLWRFGRGLVLALVVILLIGSLGLAEWAWRENPERSFFFSGTRFWELLAGSVAAFVAARRAIAGHQVLAATGLAAIVASVFVYDAATPFPSLYAGLPVGGTVLVLLFAQQGTAVARLLSTRGFVGIGLISYSAYLWHQPLFAFARIRFDSPGPGLMIGLAALSLGLAALSWRFVEQPFRRGMQPLLPHRRAVFGASAAAGAVLFLIALGIHKADGFPARATERFAGEVGHASYFADLATRFHPCQPADVARVSMTYQGYTRCFQSAPDAAPSVLLLGDSHAEHYFSGLADGLPDEVVAYYNLDQPALLATPGFAPMFRAIEANADLHTVVLTMHWLVRLKDLGGDAALLQARLGETVAHLQASGKRVVLAGDVPNFNVSAEACKFQVVASSTRSCYRALDEVTRDESRYAPVLQAVAAEYGLQTVALRDLFCDATRCSMLRGGRLMYRDRDHLSIDGSDMAGLALAAAISPQ